MIRGTRVAVVLLCGVFLFVVGGTLLLLDVVERRVDPHCLDAVAPEPAVRLIVDTDVDEDAFEILTYGDGMQSRLPPVRERIASGLPGITEMVAFLGSGQRLVAVSKHCDHPPEVVSGLARISVLPFDPEGVLAVQPDVLIVDRRLHRRDLDVIRQRVPGVLLLDTSRSLGHLSASFEALSLILGPAMGNEAHARYLAWAERRDALLASIAARRPETPPRVLVVAQWDPLYVLGRGALIDDLLRLLGCVNIACDLESDASGTFPEELVLARRPDWILTPREPMPARIAERWKHVPAVKTGQLTDGAADDLVRAGPRILAGLARLADVLLGPAGAGEAPEPEAPELESPGAGGAGAEHGGGGAGEKHEGGGAGEKHEGGGAGEKHEGGGAGARR